MNRILSRVTEIGVTELGVATELGDALYFLGVLEVLGFSGTVPAPRNTVGLSARVEAPVIIA